VKLLILGGTRFLGRHLVETALRTGHEVTLFHRGRGGCDVYPEVEHVHGDRDGDLKLLGGRTWEAAVDTSGFFPRVVRMSTELLRDAVEHYTFVSSISVYPKFTKGMDETAPVSRLDDPGTEEITEETYGALKALCEEAAEEVMPGRVLNVRAGLLVGPYDNTDRFTYWVRRVSTGGRVLVPAPPGRPVQVIHAGDLAGWILRMGEQRRGGVYHGTGPPTPHTMEEFLATCKSAAGGNAEWVWTPEEFLNQEKVTWWQDVPLCLEEKESAVMEVDVTKAVDDGLVFRPLLQTVRETLAWDTQRPPGTRLAAGLKADREVELIQRTSTHWRGP
jgi:2'-hydroxyisoflavone reductase